MANIQRDASRLQAGQYDVSDPNRYSVGSSILSTGIAGHFEGPMLRSQYPADSMENHVEYILVASFDIDRGSVMEHQYPGPISGDENMLAELMLPDQAHVRSQDWTVFFLHKDTSAEEEAREERRRIRRIKRRRRELEERGEPIPDDDDYNFGDLDIQDEQDFDDLESSDEDDDLEGPPLIYVLNLVNTKQDQSVKRYFVPCVWINVDI
jgi:Docking domain of Afi1 for Arf3 in vesicle trafficking